MQRTINKILLHCSDTPTGKVFTVSDIDQWHKDRGFHASSNGKYCGYHWVVRIDGVIEMGRYESDVGAHCQGDNQDSIGICLIGRGFYNEIQMTSLFYLLGQVCSAYGLEAKQVFGHSEMKSGVAQGKTCPMMDMNKLRDDLEMYLNGGH